MVKVKSFYLSITDSKLKQYRHVDIRINGEQIIDDDIHRGIVKNYLESQIEEFAEVYK